MHRILTRRVRAHTGPVAARAGVWRRAFRTHALAAALVSVAHRSAAATAATAATAAAPTLAPIPASASLSAVNEAVEVIDHDTAPSARARSGVLLTCEHASNALPAPYQWPAADRRLVHDHWAYDPGSADFTRELRARINGCAVLSRYSRLLIDPNRPLSSDTLIRTVADAQPVALNHSAQGTALSAEETTRRVNRFYTPYHAALRAVLTRRPSDYGLVLSVHSYTPNYEGQKRDVQIGVLYSQDPALATAIRDGFASYGHDARLNEPWSGLHGFMFAADSVAAPPARRAVMLEVRNDLLTQASWRAAAIEQLVGVLTRLKLVAPDS